MSSDKGFVQNNNSRETSNRERVERTQTKIPVVEEKLQVSKEVVETGGVRINKKVHTDDVVLEIPVKEEEFTIERVPVNQYVETPPAAMRHEGETMIVPVLKEVLVKRLVLVEEIHITRKTYQKQSSAEAALRKEEVIIEPLKPSQQTTPRKD